MTTQHWRKEQVLNSSEFPQLIEFSMCIGTYSSAKFEYIISTLFAIVEILFEKTSFGCIHNAFYLIIQRPFQSVGLSMIGNMLTEAASTLMTFFGIHSSAVVGIVNPLRIAASAENAAAILAGQEIPNIVCMGFKRLSLIGGGGSALIVTLACILFAKSKQYKKIGRAALIPGIFGIGEPILFGLPIMLNVTLFIPYILTTVFNELYSYIVIWTGLVGRFTGVVVNFTVPPLLNLALCSTTPVRAIIAQIVEILIDLAIWYPFIKVLDKTALKKEAEEQAVLEAK